MLVPHSVSIPRVEAEVTRFLTGSMGPILWMVAFLSSLTSACSRANMPEGPPRNATHDVVGGRSPADALLRAIREGNVDAVRNALRAGADPNGPGEGHRVLGLAILSDDVTIVREVIKAGADVNATTLDERAVPMLNLAVSVNGRKMVEALLGAGAKPENRGPRQPLSALAEAAVISAASVCEPLGTRWRRCKWPEPVASGGLRGRSRDRRRQTGKDAANDCGEFGSCFDCGDASVSRR